MERIEPTLFPATVRPDPVIPAAPENVGVAVFKPRRGRIVLGLCFMAFAAFGTGARYFGYGQPGTAAHGAPRDIGLTAVFVTLSGVMLLLLVRGRPFVAIDGEGIASAEALRTRRLGWAGLAPPRLNTMRVGWRQRPVLVLAGVNADGRPRQILLRDFYDRPLDAIAQAIEQARLRTHGLAVPVVAPASEAAAPLAPVLAPIRPLATYACLFVLVLAFAAEFVFAVQPGGATGDPALATLLALGGVSRQLVTQGEWWRLLTAGLLHSGFVHILLNALILRYSGRAVERLCGHAWFLVVLLLGAVGGGLGTIAYNAPGQLTIGASGGIMAVLACLFAVSFRLPSGSPERGGAQSLALRALIPSLVPLGGPGGMAIDYAAHFGGAITGGLIGLGLWGLWRREAGRAPAQPVAVALAAAMLAATGFGVVQVARRYPVYAAAAHLIPNARLPRTAKDIAEQAPGLARDYPDDPRAHILAATARLAADDRATAEAELRRAIAMESGSPDVIRRATFNMARALLADLLVKTDRRNEAVVVARPVCDAAPADRPPSAFVAGLRQSGLCAAGPGTDAAGPD